MIPESFIQDVLARTDIVSLIERYVPLKKAGANYVACCPFHNEKSPSFTVTPSKQFYHCFGCGAHGTAVGFLMEYSGLSFRDAIKDLAQQAGMQVPEDDKGDAAHRAQSQSLIEIMAQASRFYREQLKKAPEAIEYLKKRGLTGEIAARFGIGYAPPGHQALKQAFGPRYDDASLVEAGLVLQNDAGRRYDRFRERVMFPIQDQRGNVIAFGGRIIGPGEPKYLNSPETPLFEKGRELYGLPQARQALRDSGCVVVVEGYMDVVALAQYGFGSAVATLGTATTPMHIQKLFRQAERVVFCFDGDKAGVKAARRALENSLEHLADDKEIRFLFLPPEHDPDSYIRESGLEAFHRAVGEAMPLSEYLLKVLKADLNLSTAEDRARMIHDAKALVPRISAPILRLQTVRMLSEESGLTPEEIMAALGIKANSSSGKRAAPPARAPRSNKLSILRQLLSALAHFPDLCAKLPADLYELAGHADEWPLIQRLVDLHDDGCADNAILVTLMERFRDTPQQQIAGELMMQSEQHPLTRETADEELADILQKLRLQSLDLRFQQLQQLAAQGKLDGDQSRQYLELLSLKQKLKTGQKHAQ